MFKLSFGLFSLSFVVAGFWGGASRMTRILTIQVPAGNMVRAEEAHADSTEHVEEAPPAGDSEIDIR